jgi:hypothetical protein
MWYSAWCKLIGTSRKIWGDFIIGLLGYFTALAGSSENGFLSKRIDNQIIKSLIIFTIGYVIILVVRFVLALIEYKVFGAEIDFIPDEKESLKDIHNMQMEKCIKLMVSNGRKSKISDCFVKLVDIEKIYNHDKSETSLEEAHLLWNEIIDANIEPRLCWEVDNLNLTDKDCVAVLPGKSRRCVQVARVVMHKLNYFGKYIIPAKIIFGFCNMEKDMFSADPGVYKLRLLIDGMRGNEEYSEEFKTYLYIGIDETEEENGFFLITKFRRGNPKRDREIRKIFNL